MPINLADIEWDDEEPKAPTTRQVSSPQDDIEWDEPDIEWDKPELTWERAGGVLKEGTKDVTRSSMTGIGAMLQHGLPEIYRKGLESAPGIGPIVQALNKGQATGAVPPIPTEKLGTPILEAARSPELKPSLEYADSSGYIEDFLRSAPQMGGQMITSMALGPLWGLGFMGSQIAGGTYEEAVSQGKDPKNALAWGIANAIVQSPMEQLGIGKIAGLWSPQKQLIRKLKDIGEAMGTEWLTEFLQGIPEAISSIFALNPDKTAKENITKVANALPKELARSAYEGTLTAPWALLGLAGGVERPHYISGSMLPGPNHPFIQKVKADLNDGKLTEDDVTAMKGMDEVRAMGLEEQLDRVILDYRIGAKRANMADALKRTVTAAPGEERGDALTDLIEQSIWAPKERIPEAEQLKSAVVAQPGEQRAKVLPDAITLLAEPEEVVAPPEEEEAPAEMIGAPPTRKATQKEQADMRREQARQSQRAKRMGYKIDESRIKRRLNEIKRRGATPAETALYAGITDPEALANIGTSFEEVAALSEELKVPWSGLQQAQAPVQAAPVAQKAGLPTAYPGQMEITQPGEEFEALPAARERKGLPAPEERPARPTPVEKVSGAPILPPGRRWAGDRGAMPGEPFAYLDGETAEDAKAALIERTDDQENVLYEAMTSEGESLGVFATVEQAAKATEKAIPLEKEEAKAQEKAKEPWEMTKEEWIRSQVSKTGWEQYQKDKQLQKAGKATTGFAKVLDAKHEVSLLDALSEGKEVPEAVLKDYPELQKKEVTPSETEAKAETVLEEQPETSEFYARTTGVPKAGGIRVTEKEYVGVGRAPAGNWAFYAYKSPTKQGRRILAGTRVKIPKFYATKEEAQAALDKYARENKWEPIAAEAMKAEVKGKRQETKQKRAELEERSLREMMSAKEQLEQLISFNQWKTPAQREMPQEEIDLYRKIYDRWVSKHEGPTEEEIGPRTFLRDMFEREAKREKLLAKEKAQKPVPAKKVTPEKPIMVTVKAIRGATGEEFAVERPFLEVQAELNEQRTACEKILECLNG